MTHNTNEVLGNDIYTLSPNDIKKFSRQQVIQVLRELRIRPLDRPQITLMCATHILAGGGGGLASDEIYNIREQCIIAALKCGQIDLAKHQLKTLQKSFKMKSIRVMKLEGLICEAQGEMEKARKIYTYILCQKPDDEFVIKRNVAMLKTLGDIPAAISVLENRKCYEDEDQNALTFKEVHALDLNTNKELCSLHLQIDNREQALFYAEECILCDPFDYTLHIRHGELAYSFKQYDRALAAFAHSTRLNNSANNTRSVYGIWMTASQALKQPQLTKADVTRYKGLKEAAVERLKGVYAGSELAYVVDLMLQE